MKQFFSVLLLAAGLLLANSHVNAQKIAYINTDEVVDLMPEAADMQAKLQTYHQSLIQNAQDKQNAFNDDVDKFMKDSATMNESLKEVKRKELQKRSVELNNLQQDIQQSLQEKQQELAAPILKKLQDAIEKVAKQKGYTYVVAREALLVVPASDDLAPAVISELGLKKPDNSSSK